MEQRFVMPWRWTRMAVFSTLRRRTGAREIHAQEVRGVWHLHNPPMLHRSGQTFDVRSRDGTCPLSTSTNVPLAMPVSACLDLSHHRKPNLAYIASRKEHV